MWVLLKLAFASKFVIYQCLGLSRVSHVKRTIVNFSFVVLELMVVLINRDEADDHDPEHQHTSDDTSVAS